MVAILLVSLRPKQWIKNVLIFTVPFASQVRDLSLWGDLLIGFVLFCLIASSVYIFNDIYDIDSDKHHPMKKFRAVASGRMSRKLAWLLCFTSLLLSLVIMALFIPSVTLLIFAYLGINLVYTLGLKLIPFVEVIAVASGFVIRILVGAQIASVDPSSWTLICSLSGAMFVVLGKRYAEKKSSLVLNNSNYRKVLDSYTEDGLRTNLTVAASVFAGGYIQWASQLNTANQNRVWSLISSIGVLVFLMSYIEAIHRGKGEQPERDLIHSAPQIVLIALTLLSIVFAVLTK